MNFYFEAAETLDHLDNKQGSIKSILASLPEKQRKRTSALIIQTLKYRNILNELILKTAILKEERKKLTSRSLVLVLLHDLLFAPGGIQAGDGPIKQAILRHKTRLQAELTKLKVRRGVSFNADLEQKGVLGAAEIPRYVRVNTLLWSALDAIKHFVHQGFTQTDIYDGNKKSFAQDGHVNDLLLFHPSTSFQDDTAYRSGKVILQDKASCFPAVVLKPPSGPIAQVIDATSAPGNKTSHLSALMNGQGMLFAFERDRKRFNTLKTMLDRARCKNVEAINRDFLTVDPEDEKFRDVTHILLDPSCSGSGIVNRLDYLLDQPEQEEDEGQAQDRLQKLATFQLTIIQHAMKFPNVERIVYSTCSIHAVENEHVVADALISEEARRGNFILAPRDEVIPTWPRRGLNDKLSKDDCSKVIRCEPGVDATNGFFVSCFVKEGPSLNRPKKRLLEDGNGAEQPKKKKRKKKKKPDQSSLNRS